MEGTIKSLNEVKVSTAETNADLLSKLSLDELVIGLVNAEIPLTRLENPRYNSTKFRDIIEEYREEHSCLLHKFYKQCKTELGDELRKLVLRDCTQQELDEIIESNIYL